MRVCMYVMRVVFVRIVACMFRVVCVIRYMLCTCVYFDGLRRIFALCMWKGVFCGARIIYTQHTNTTCTSQKNYVIAICDIKISRTLLKYIYLLEFIYNTLHTTRYADYISTKIVRILSFK